MTNIKRIVTSFWIIRYFMRASYCSQDWTVNVKYFKDFNCVKVNKTIQKPCSLSQPLSWMKPMKGAMPVPGPTMITGLVALKGRRNWDLRINIGTVDLWPLSDISLFFSQLVATPLFRRPVFVWYSTTTAQMWMLLGWTFTAEDYKTGLRWAGGGTEPEEQRLRLNQTLNLRHEVLITLALFHHC